VVLVAAGDPAVAADAAADEAKEAAEVAGACGPHVLVVRALGLAPMDQPWALIGAGAATVVEARLSNWASDLTLAAFCVLASASYLGLEIYACLWAGQSQAFLARFRSWIDSRTDQLIIAGSMILGLWLIGKSIYLIVS
jgi:Sap, sulfolipid-1-addressing protein